MPARLTPKAAPQFLPICAVQMLSFFRRVSKSKFGTGIMAGILIAILAGFAVADIRNFGSGDVGFGDEQHDAREGWGPRITEREMSDACSGVCSKSGSRIRSRLFEHQRRLRSDAGTVIDERAADAFADKYGFSFRRGWSMR